MADYPHASFSILVNSSYDEYVKNVLANESVYIAPMQKWIESTGSV